MEAILMLAETVEKFKKIYASKPDIIEFMISKGDEQERAIGLKIKQTALSK